MMSRASGARARKLAGAGAMRAAACQAATIASRASSPAGPAAAAAAVVSSSRRELEPPVEAVNGRAAGVIAEGGHLSHR